MVLSILSSLIDHLQGDFNFFNTLQVSLLISSVSSIARFLMCSYVFCTYSIYMHWDLIVITSLLIFKTLGWFQYLCIKAKYIWNEIWWTCHIAPPISITDYIWWWFQKFCTVFVILNSAWHDQVETSVSCGSNFHLDSCICVCWLAWLCCE